MMASPLKHTILLWVLMSATSTRAGNISNSPLKYSSAKSEFWRICVALSESSIEQNLTLVFVLFVDPRFEIPLDRLRELPRALVYLSNEDVVLGGREREIVVSWERDPQYDARYRDDRFETKYWDLSGNCGHHENGCQSLTAYYLLYFRLEKRVLLQIREWPPSNAEQPLALIQERISGDYWLFYYQRYRAIFIIVRIENEDRLHSQITVRRTGEIIGKHVWKLTAEEFSLDHARNLFQPREPALNRTDDFAPELQGVFFPAGGGRMSGIRFGSCDVTNKAYLHAYESLTVRLAIPLPWQTELISSLPKYLALEIPLTLLSFVALPVLLKIRRRRTIRPTPSTWNTVYHLLSGDATNSLIESVKQTTLVLLISGVVSLLLQYPISLLKGEVISSSYERRIQPSVCVVDTCWLYALRDQWYEKQSLVGALARKENMAELFRESSLKLKCASSTASTSGMMNWTVLALLTQYLPVCDDPVLMKMQLAKWGRNLAFELLPGSHATQTVCSSSFSTGGHVEPRKHFQITRCILEHGLLKYPHVKSSLSAKNNIDFNFWSRLVRPAQWADPFLIKPKIESVVNTLKEGYARYKMLERGSDSEAIKLEGLRVIFLAFLSATCSVLLGFLLRYGLCLIPGHPFCILGRVTTGLLDERRVPANTVGSTGTRLGWVGDVGEVMMRRSNDELRDSPVPKSPEPDSVPASSSRQDTDERNVCSRENSVVD